MFCHKKNQNFIKLPVVLRPRPAKYRPKSRFSEQFYVRTPRFDEFQLFGEFWVPQTQVRVTQTLRKRCAASKHRLRHAGTPSTEVGGRAPLRRDPARAGLRVGQTALIVSCGVPPPPTTCSTCSCEPNVLQKVFSCVLGLCNVPTVSVLP